MVSKGYKNPLLFICQTNIVMKNIRMIFLIVVQFAIGILGLRAQTELSNDELKNRIDTFLTKSVANGFSGSVLVAKKGNVILSKGYGWADRSVSFPHFCTIQN